VQRRGIMADRLFQVHGKIVALINGMESMVCLGEPELIVRMSKQTLSPCKQVGLRDPERQHLLQIWFRRSFQGVPRRRGPLVGQCPLGPLPGVTSEPELTLLLLRGESLKYSCLIFISHSRTWADPTERLLTFTSFSTPRLMSIRTWRCILPSKYHFVLSRITKQTNPFIPRNYSMESMDSEPWIPHLNMEMPVAQQVS
jgi:hypothetical protein